MTEIRCTKCNKLLCKASFPLKAGDLMEVPDEVGINGVKKNGETLEIRCPRCKTLNEIMV